MAAWRAFNLLSLSLNISSSFFAIIYYSIFNFQSSIFLHHLSILVKLHDDTLAGINPVLTSVAILGHAVGRTLCHLHCLLVHTLDDASLLYGSHMVGRESLHVC